MADLERVKTWGVEILKKDDLNAEFDNVVNHVNTLVETKMAAGPTITGPTMVGTVTGGTYSNYRDAQQVLNANGSVTLGKHVILCSAADITVTLPTSLLATDGYRVTIKDISGSAGSTPITIAGQGAQEIDGNASIQVVEDYGSITLEGYDSKWYII